MRSIVTIDGIDKALSNLQYRNEKSLKYRLIHAIRDYYNATSSIASINEIVADELVKKLWNTGNDQIIIRNRRKNFNSIKSTVNTDLKRLFRDGNNPEGIIINSKNVFDMSDEAKSEFLESFSYYNNGNSHIPFEQIADVLKIVNDFLTNKDPNVEDNDKLDQLKELLSDISGKIGIPENDDSRFEHQEGKSTGSGDFYLKKDEKDEPEEEIEELLEDEEEIEDDEELEELEVEDESEEEIEELLEDEEQEDEFEVIEDNEDFEKAEIEYTLQDLLDEYGDKGYEDEDGIKKAKFLADEFDKALSAMDKYYNQYILIPKGRYIVGRERSEKYETGIQKISLKEFFFGKFPVTNNLFELFVEKTGYVTTAERVGYGTVYKGRCQCVVDSKTGMETLNWNSSLIGEKVDGACWYQPNGPESNLHGKRNHPVVQISLEDALSFAVWTGKRLPSEHEWEAATRTSNGYEYPWGKIFKENSCNIESSFVGDTTPVDRYEKNINRYGIVDAVGNVLEWTRDKKEISMDESKEVFEHIVKGGSWISCDNLRLSDRLSIEPDHTSNILGFRCVAY